MIVDAIITVVLLLIIGLGLGAIGFIFGMACGIETERKLWLKSTAKRASHVS